jgi:hypothetical protein
LIRATRALSRRMFLKAIALGLSVPLAAKLARIASAGPGTAPKRFFVFYMPHGVPVEHYNPQVSPSDPTNFALDMTGVSILGPLQKYKSYVNVYQGFKYLGGGTHEGIVNCLSGVGGPKGTDTTLPRTTVDQVIAKGLGVKPLILGACSHQTYGLDLHGMLFWDGTAIDPLKNPAAVADSLFAKPTNPNMSDAQLRSQLLTLTESEIQSLQKELSQLTAEQTKLQTHLMAIQAMQANGMAPMSSCTMAPSLPAVDQVRTASAGNMPQPGGAGDYFYEEANFQLLFQAQLELAAQALVCNAAQVIGLMPMWATCEFNFAFSQPGGTAPPGGWGHHTGLSHTSPQAAPGAQYNSPLQVSNYLSSTRQAFAKAQLWFAQQLDKYVLSVLANTPEPGYPGQMVLDNTLVYWMSEIGDGADHDTTSKVLYPQVPEFLPLVSIGKCGGGLKTGMVYHSATDRPAGDLYLTFCKAMGVSNASFPDAVGPVTEVL